MIKKRAGRRKDANVRPWTFDEIPIGSVVEYEDKSWSGSITLHREIITGARNSENGVEVCFGSQHIPTEKLVDGAYKLLRDGQSYPCGILSSDHDVLTPMEKFKVAKLFAGLIGADDVFAREFANDTLDVKLWLESARSHKVLLGTNGQVKAIWLSKVEPDPEMSLQEMCDVSSLTSAYHFALGKLGMLAKVKGGSGLSINAPANPPKPPQN